MALNQVKHNLSKSPTPPIDARLEKEEKEKLNNNNNMGVKSVLVMARNDVWGKRTNELN